MLEATFHEAYPLVRRAAQVHAAAATMAGSLPNSDRQDLEQEGLLALWRALPRFDSSRASITTFAERVVANQIASVVRAQRALRRIPVPTNTSAYSDHAGYSVELGTDVERVLADLPEDDRRLARLLAEYSPTEASRMLRVSRSSVYEGIRRIRIAFLEAGLAPGSASCRIPKSQIEDRVTKECCGPDSGERDTSDRIGTQATHAEQIGTCLTLFREVA
jgi:RNA polymerase sigma factor (sigma-70 family)